MYALEVESLTQKYSDKVILDNISFKVKENTVHGFLGPNGAGKTTTLKSICGIIPIFSGQVKFFEKIVDYQTSQYKMDFGALIEEPTLYEDMKVYEFLKFTCKLYKIPKSEINKSIEDALEKILIQDISHRLIKNLSKGYKQRVAIAASIIHNPKIIILDEPTVGLDVSAISQMREVILKLKKNHTVLISSHILHEMELLCDEVTLIDKSKIIASKNLTQTDNTQINLTLDNKKELSIDEIKLKLNEAGLDFESINHAGFNLEQFFFTSIRRKDDS
jgi:ABC-2 type transport system ATP-binding protein